MRQVRRAQVLLLAADGVSNVEVAQRCDESRPTVLAWRKQFESVRTMAARVGVSPRIWSQLGLQPHLVATFKISNDPGSRRN